MIEEFKEAYTVLNDLTCGLLGSILLIIPLSVGMNLIFRIVKIMCRGEYTPIQSEQIRSEPIRADPPKVNLTKTELDSDLKKYFNYNIDR